MMNKTKFITIDRRWKKKHDDSLFFSSLSICGVYYKLTVLCSCEEVKMEFSTSEYADMHLVYGFCECNASEAARVYAERYPQRRHPTSRVFIRLHDRMVNENCLVPRRSAGRSAGYARANVEEAILEAVHQDPTTSTRRIAEQLGTNKSLVQRTLMEEGLHPFHLTKVQELVAGDYEARVEFCQFLLDKNRRDPHFLQNVCWTDESSFERQGIVNNRNTHYWAVDNPKLSQAHHFQYRGPRLNLWGGIMGNEVHIRLLPSPLNGTNYLEFLENFLPEIIPDEEDIWIQMDGAPAHASRAVVGFLNERFPDRWIGRGGPIRWPPRSPDLTPLDFFLWGFLKEKISSLHLERPELEQIQNIAASISQETFHRVRQDILQRARLCIAAGGGHFEHLLH